MEQIRIATKSSGKLALTYTLLKSDGRYTVSVREAHGDEATADFTGTEYNAISFLKAICRGCVTPCALSDVVEDSSQSFDITPVE